MVEYVIQRQKAFTLIELLVVLAIMATLFSLVAPMSQVQVDKTKALAEWKTIQQLTRSAAQHAYTHGTAVVLEVKGTRLLVSDKHKQLTSLGFEQVFFNTQQVRFNANGYPDQIELTAFVRGVPRKVSLEVGFDAYPSKK